MNIMVGPKASFVRRFHCTDYFLSEQTYVTIMPSILTMLFQSQNRGQFTPPGSPHWNFRERTTITFFVLYALQDTNYYSKVPLYFPISFCIPPQVWQGCQWGQQWESHLSALFSRQRLYQSCGPSTCLCMNKVNLHSSPELPLLLLLYCIFRVSQTLLF